MISPTCSFGKHFFFKFPENWNLYVILQIFMVGVGGERENEERRYSYFCIAYLSSRVGVSV